MKIVRNDYWFKPKSFGYGAQPVTWDGWLSTAVFIILLFWIASGIT
ncbi:MAG: hypothetical protein KKA06_07410 [Nanoarchaeota archaeon]|nr:hypothetical protein [Nanoarchaeota archaeon]